MAEKWEIGGVRREFLWLRVGRGLSFLFFRV